MSIINREQCKNFKAFLGMAGIAVFALSFMTLKNTNEINKTKTTETDTTKTTETDTTKTTEKERTKITETEDKTTIKPWIQFISAGVAVSFGSAYLAQDIEERRKYKLLSQSNSKIIKLLCRKDEPKLDSNLKKTLENQLEDNFKEQNKLLNDDSITNSSIEESMNKNFESMKELISNSQESINEKLDDINKLLEHSPNNGSRQGGNSSSSQEQSMANGKA